jgi:hypothetical protein
VPCLVIQAYKKMYSAFSIATRQMSACRNRSAFAMTETELNVIAALAQIGLISRPMSGYSTPAATGTPTALYTTPETGSADVRRIAQGHVAADATAVLPEADELLDLLDREPEVAGAADESQRVNVRVVLKPITRVRAPGFLQQPERFIVTNRLRRDSRAPGRLTDVVEPDPPCMCQFHEYSINLPMMVMSKPPPFAYFAMTRLHAAAVLAGIASLTPLKGFTTTAGQTPRRGCKPTTCAWRARQTMARRGSTSSCSPGWIVRRVRRSEPQ